MRPRLGALGAASPALPEPASHRCSVGSSNCGTHQRAAGQLWPMSRASSSCARLHLPAASCDIPLCATARLCGTGLRSRIDRAHGLDVSRGRGERGVGVEVGEWEGRARPGGRSVLRQAKRRQEQEQAPLPSARPSGCLPRRTPSIAARTCARCISPSLRSISAQSPVLVPPLVEPTPSTFAQPPNQPSQPCVSHHRLSYRIRVSGIPPFGL